MVLVEPIEINVLRAPASVYGTPTEIGSAYERDINILEHATTGEWVYFKKHEESVGEQREIFYVQQPKEWVEITGSYDAPVCYPPPFGGNKAILLNQAPVEVESNPFYIQFVLPPTTPTGARNSVRIEIPYLRMVITVSHDGLISFYGQNGLIKSAKGEFSYGQWGALVGAMTVFFGKIYSPKAGGAIAFVYINVGERQIECILKHGSTTEHFAQMPLVSLYGALRVWKCKYHKGALNVLPAQIPSGLATPTFLWIEDFNGRLYHTYSYSFPNDRVPADLEFPVILRKVMAIHKPVKPTSGGFVPYSVNIISVDWDYESATLKGYNLDNLGWDFGDIVCISFNGYNFYYKVDSIEIERTGEDNRKICSMKLVAPLKVNYHTLPVKFNPYLLRIYDILEIMDATIHTVFTVAFPPNTDLNKIISIDGERNFNSLTDYCDFLATILSTHTNELKFYIRGSSIQFASSTSPLPWTYPAPQFVLSENIIREPVTAAVYPTGIAFGDTSKGIVISLRGVPIDFKFRATFAGLVMFPQPYIFLTVTGGALNGKKIKVSEIHYSYTKGSMPTTEFECGVMR